MARMNDPRVVANYLHCLSMLENNTFLLYQKLSEKAEMPLVKTLLFSIAQDSLKHSALLSGIADSVTVSKEKAEACAKKLGETWRVIDTFLEEITGRERISKMEFGQLIEKLTVLESSVGEEYYIFVQMKTLQHMVKEINQLYNINLERTKNIFMSIIEDEEHHRELLATIKDLLSENEPQSQDSTPKIKYQNPDSWIQ
jgi:rubrerythrin